MNLKKVLKRWDRFCDEKLLFSLFKRVVLIFKKVLSACTYKHF
jgi:hypothetical protein